MLTDKTGTLTKNEMVFKKVALEFTQFDEETLNEISDIVKKQCEDFPGPVADLRDKARG